MNTVTYSETAQRSAQELHEAIVAHNESIKEAMLRLLGNDPGTNKLSDDALDAMLLICSAMSALTEKLGPAED